MKQTGRTKIEDKLRNAKKILVGESEGKRPRGRTRIILEWIS
jgi:hypothetical protein